MHKQEAQIVEGESQESLPLQIWGGGTISNYLLK
jgi:hypothetical protein